MRLHRLLILVICCGLCLPAPSVVQTLLGGLARGEDEPTTSAHPLRLAQAHEESPHTLALDGAQRPEEYWKRVTAAMRAGAYQDALASLETLRRLSPNDPWVELYRAMGQSRLQSPSAIGPISAAQLQALDERLRLERDMTRLGIEKRRAVERAIAGEQSKWNRDLKRLEEQTARRRERTQREVQQIAAREAASQRRARERLAAVSPAAPTTAGPAAGGRGPWHEEPAEAPAVAAPEAPTPVVEEEGAPVAPVTRSGGAGGVELAPVVVPMAQAPAAEERPAMPAPPAPPVAAGIGAVEINARQMTVSPERHLAVAEGDVEVLYGSVRMTCDRLTVFTDTNDAYADGHVRIQDGDQVFRADLAHYNFDTKKGRFLEGTVLAPPWHEFGRWSEVIAEGVYRVRPGYVTTCDHDPPHFKLMSSEATVFADDHSAHARNVALVIDRTPVFFLPWMNFANEQSPFFITPGKRKPWGPFALMGYRYELPGVLRGDSQQRGTMRMDWRRDFDVGLGLDHQFESQQLGNGLLKVYYNDSPNKNVPVDELPKGAQSRRYRLLWRHDWRPLPETSMVTDIQEFSDVDFRKDLLFREEYTQDDLPESFISVVTNTPAYSLSESIRKRMNRFQSVTEALPEVRLDVREQRIGETPLFSQTQLGFANLQSKTAHSDVDADVVRVDWFQRLSYAVNWLRPFEVIPYAGIRETYYNKDNETPANGGKRNILVGQPSFGADASLKLFRIFSTTTNWLGLDLHQLRHVLTPTVSYRYVHEPTLESAALTFPTAEATSNGLTFGIENKLQTKRPGPGGGNRLASVDLARFLISIPYTFHGSGNKQGGRLGDWSFDLETYPWPWMRLESDWRYEPIPLRAVHPPIPIWNLDLIMVGGGFHPLAQDAPDIQTPQLLAFRPGLQGGGIHLMPQGQWYLGLGHRYSRNDKTEDVLEYDWQLSEKWQLGMFHRFTWKEVAGGQKRFNNHREYQYTLRRDLHDWVGEFAYHVDREFGEDLYFMLTLKAFPEMPIAASDSYHQPKIGSQSSPFSPVPRS